METQQHDLLLEQVDALIETMSEFENELYVAIEVAHQLRDEILQVELDTSTDNNE